MKNIFFILIVLLTGCNSMTFKNFAYLDINNKYSWGILHAKLIGKDIEIDNSMSMRKEPYRLILSFINPNTKSNTIFIDKIELYYIENNVNIFEEKNKSLKVKFRQGNQHNSAIIFFNDINFKYKNLKLLVTFHFSEDKQPYLIQEKFIIDYQENKISFWDILMGV